MAVYSGTHADGFDLAFIATGLQAVNRPSITVHLDCMHPVRTGKVTMKRTFAASQP